MIKLYTLVPAIVDDQGGYYASVSISSVLDYVHKIVFKVFILGKPTEIETSEFLTTDEELHKFANFLELVPKVPEAGVNFYFQFSNYLLEFIITGGNNPVEYWIKTKQIKLPKQSVEKLADALRSYNNL